MNNSAASDRLAPEETPRAVVLSEKRCPNCETVKPLSEFYKKKGAKDGRSWECRTCATERARRWNENRRAEIGDAAFRAENRDKTRRLRAKHGGVAPSDRINNASRNEAIRRLIDAHRREFDALLRVARYEIEAAHTDERNPR